MNKTIWEWNNYRNYNQLYCWLVLFYEFQDVVRNRNIHKNYILYDNEEYEHLHVYRRRASIRICKFILYARSVRDCITLPHTPHHHRMFSGSLESSSLDCLDKLILIPQLCTMRYNEIIKGTHKGHVAAIIRSLQNYNNVWRAIVQYTYNTMYIYVYDHRAWHYATVFNKEKTVRRGFAEENLLTLQKKSICKFISCSSCCV